MQNKADLAEVGREKQKQTLKQFAGNADSVLSFVDKTAPKHNTQKEIANSAGVATGTIGKAEVVRREAPELWEKAKAGKLTVNAAYRASWAGRPPFFSSPLPKNAHICPVLRLNGRRDTSVIMD
ncbi:MAG: hypothetical protein C4B58_05260 [Deltaproteobacteria bacterium]|nr:MAG: hypothetical protein C4B58_05260 [Deltaproteobacteria bacterium]